MITEDYIGFETAKLLKEKGFDEKCTHYYKNEKYLVDLGYSNINSYTNSDLVEEFAAPTLQMAMKWLSQEKNIIINVWYNGVDWDAEYYNNEDENFYLITDYSCNSYEQACETAIKYCLQNLI